MAITTPIFALAADLAVTSWGSGLTTGLIGSSAAQDNGADKFVDMIVGGVVESGTTPAAGGTMDVYASGQYDEAVAGAFGGGLDANITGVDEQLTVDTEVQLAGLHIIRSLTAISVLGGRFGPQGIAQFFGGVPPETWLNILHNNTSVTMTAGSILSFIGLKWDST